MARDMKFHIYNMEHEPLCWGEEALEFDSAEAAYDFLRDADDLLCDMDEDLLESCVVVQDILFYDGGYINATDLRIHGDELVKREEK